MIGAVAAFLVESVGHIVYPPPEGTDLSDPEQLRTIMESVPTGALLFVLGAWAIGSYLGGMVATILARAAQWPGVAVGGLMLLGGIYTMIIIPHPWWMAAAGVIVLFVPAWIAARQFGGRSFL